MCLNPIYLSEKNFSRFKQDKLLWRLKLEHKLKGDELIPLPCGKCVECLQARANEWTYRLLDEISHHREFCFVTLTYKETDGELLKRDYQLFLKRLRKRIAPQKIRYFLCGEYGSKKQRPHYHLILFGWFPPDCEYFYEKDNIKYYKSEFLQDIWSLGFVLVQRLAVEHLKYVVKYMSKLVNYDDKLQKPFIAMSTKPGIGFESIDAFDLLDDKRYYNGRAVKIPRYYLKKLKERGFGEEIEQLKSDRVKRALFSERNTKELYKRQAKIYKKLYAKTFDEY